MKLGVIKLTHNIQDAEGPIGAEAPEYFDVWVESNGGTVPLRLTPHEYERAKIRGIKQLEEVESLEPTPWTWRRLFGGK